MITDIYNYFFRISGLKLQETVISWRKSISPWRGEAERRYFYVHENNKNLQITNFAGLRRVIRPGKTLEHWESQLICMTWQRLRGSAKYLSVYFSKCGNIFIAWSGSPERMQIVAHATHISRARLLCPWWKWAHASPAHLYSPQPTFNIETPQS